MLARTRLAFPGLRLFSTSTPYRMASTTSNTPVEDAIREKVRNSSLAL